MLRYIHAKCGKNIASVAKFINQIVRQVKDIQRCPSPDAEFGLTTLATLDMFFAHFARI